MFRVGAPAEGYCAATCGRCPAGSSPSPAAAAPPPPPPTMTPAATAAPACEETAPRGGFSCADLVCAAFCLWPDAAFVCQRQVSDCWDGRHTGMPTEWQAYSSQYRSSPACLLDKIMLRAVYRGLQDWGQLLSEIRVWSTSRPAWWR